jgi:hypothetical protein
VAAVTALGHRATRLRRFEPTTTAAGSRGGSGEPPDTRCSNGQAGTSSAKYLYKVVRPIPSVLQMVAAVSPLSFIRRASAACSAVSLAGRPNLRPDVRA